MKRFSLFAISALALLLTSCTTTAPQTRLGEAPPWLQDIENRSRLVAEIHGLSAVDQFERNKIVALLNDQTIPAAEKDARVKELGDMITRNDKLRSERLKAIFQTTNLMQMSQIDPSLARSAFLIIIHAETDLPFQKSQLPIAFELGKKGIIGNQEYSILTDKIAVAEGKPQVYGTQGECENAVWRIKGPHDRAAISTARSEIGLEPLDDYLKHGASLYGCGAPGQ
jgi:hypothetical protein